MQVQVPPHQETAVGMCIQDQKNIRNPHQKLLAAIATPMHLKDILRQIPTDHDRAMFTLFHLQGRHPLSVLHQDRITALTHKVEVAEPIHHLRGVIAVHLRQAEVTVAQADLREATVAQAGVILRLRVQQTPEAAFLLHDHQVAVDPAEPAGQVAVLRAAKEVVKQYFSIIFSLFKT